jgi:hypothetical protein
MIIMELLVSLYITIWTSIRKRLSEVWFQNLYDSDIRENHNCFNGEIRSLGQLWLRLFLFFYEAPITRKESLYARRLNKNPKQLIKSNH